MRLPLCSAFQGTVFFGVLFQPRDRITPLEKKKRKMIQKRSLFIDRDLAELGNPWELWRGELPCGKNACKVGDTN